MFIHDDEILSVRVFFFPFVRMLVLCVKMREFGGILHKHSHHFHVLSHSANLLKLRFG